MAFIIKPLVTEKMTSLTEKRPNCFGFIVRPEANKLQIKEEVEKLHTFRSHKRTEERVQKGNRLAEGRRNN